MWIDDLEVINCDFVINSFKDLCDLMVFNFVFVVFLCGLELVEVEYKYISVRDNILFIFKCKND